MTLIELHDEVVRLIEMGYGDLEVVGYDFVRDYVTAVEVDDDPWWATEPLVVLA